MDFVLSIHWLVDNAAHTNATLQGELLTLAQTLHDQGNDWETVRMW